MVREFGMSGALGTIPVRKKESEIFLGRDIMAQQREYSEKTAELIDSEVKRIIQECGARARKLLDDNFEKLTKLAEALIEKEVLEGEEVDELFGVKRPQAEKKTEPPPPNAQAPSPRPFINPSASGGPIPQPAT